MFIYATSHFFYNADALLKSYDRNRDTAFGMNKNTINCKLTVLFSHPRLTYTYKKFSQILFYFCLNL